MAGIILEIGKLRRRYVLNVMTLGSFGLQLAADVIRHLAILLALLRAALMLVIALIALVIYPGEDQHIEDQQAAAYGYRYTQSG